MPNELAEDQNRVRELLDKARRVVAFTGAGISTECGVPDFRSSDSPWRQHAPLGFAAFLADPSVRVEAWRRKFAMDDIYAGAEPGRTHRALSRLAEAGRLDTVITQNIDGLHQAAGLPAAKLVELHGNGTYATCLSCGRRHELRRVRADLSGSGAAPVCDCGGIVKSATISFGQPLPLEAVHRAHAAALDCDLFLVLGSSLVVQPAARFPLIAKQNGAQLVIINREATRLEAAADVSIQADVGAVLEPWTESF